jgi:uncharacterized membrane protein YgcG
MSSCDNDVLILLSVNDRQIYISMGSVASRVIPTQVKDEIFIGTRGHFTNGYYFQGLEAMVGSYYDTLKMIDRLPSNEGEEETGRGGVNVLLIVGAVIGFCVLIVALIAILCYVKTRMDNNESVMFDMNNMFTRKKSSETTPPKAMSTPITGGPGSENRVKGYVPVSMEDPVPPPVNFGNIIKENEKMVKAVMVEMDAAEEEAEAEESSSDEDESSDGEDGGDGEGSEYDQVAPDEDGDEDAVHRMETLDVRHAYRGQSPPPVDPYYAQVLPKKGVNGKGTQSNETDL